MAIIPSDTRFIGIADFVDLTERRSAQINSQSEPYTMTDIVDTVSAGIPTGADWGEISGTLSNQTDLQSALDAKQDTLVSGTNIKTINSTSILGSGDIETASVNSTENYIPINIGDEFIDSPIYGFKDAGSDGYSELGTKVNRVVTFPEGGISASSNFGLEIKGLFTLFGQNQSSVSIGDYEPSFPATSQGEFYYYTGQPLTSDSSGQPPNQLATGTSGIVFSTNTYNLFESTMNYFKLDAKSGNPSRVDGLLFNLNVGVMGFGRGLNALTQSSSEESIVWNINENTFVLKGTQGYDVINSDRTSDLTYLANNGDSRIGVSLDSFYVSNFMILTASPTTQTKVLKVIDNSGNDYYIRLYETT